MFLEFAVMSMVMTCLISSKSHWLGRAPPCGVKDGLSFEVGVALLCGVVGAPSCVVGDGSGINTVVLLGLTVEVPKPLCPQLGFHCLALLFAVLV